MDSTFIIKPCDSRQETKIKINNRLQHFMDARIVSDWLHYACCSDSEKSKSLLINNKPSFVALIRQECLKYTMFQLEDADLVDAAVQRVVRCFLAVEKNDVPGSWAGTRAGTFKVSACTDSLVCRESATFVRWEFNVPHVFRDIAEPFFNFEYSSSVGEDCIGVVDETWPFVGKLELPPVPYLSGFYTYHCELLYEELDEVVPCKMFSFLTAKGFGRKAHTLTAQLRVRYVIISSLDDVRKRTGLKDAGVFNDDDMTKFV